MANSDQPEDSAEFLNPFNESVLIAYFERLRLRYGTVKLVGLPQVDERNDDLPLEALFVQPQVSPQPAGASGESLVQALAAHRRLVLLGDPGSGKTTIVKWLCTGLAQPRPNELNSALQRAVPLCFTLRDLSLGSVKTWDDLWREFLESPRSDGVLLWRSPELLAQLLESGQALILLDGIDEVSSAERRHALRRAVWQGWKRHPRCRWLLTSRIVGYNEVPFHGDPLGGKSSRNFPGQIDFPLDKESAPMLRALSAKLINATMADRYVPREAFMKHGRQVFGDVLYVAPFSNDQIHRFIENWYRIREPDPVLRAESAGELKRVLDGHAATKELARVPNLLTLIALVHRVRAKLPDGRAELYGDIAQAYLKTIDAHRGFDGPSYTFDEKMQWLARVAWEMQQLRTRPPEAGDDGTVAPEYLATEADLLAWLSLAMTARFGSLAPVEAAKFVDYLRRRTGLLVERGEERFAFLHLSFQEFFAAHYVRQRVSTPAWAAANLYGVKKASGDVALSLRALTVLVEQTVWQEVFVFLFELLPGDWVQPILEAFTTKPEAAVWSKKAAERWLLAARVAGDPHVTIDDDFRRELMLRIWKWWLFWTGRENAEWVSLCRKRPIPHQLLSRAGVRPLAWRTLSEAWGSGTSLLILDGCPDLTDLMEIPPLAGLRRLSLNGATGVRDLSPLSKLEGLERLWLDECTEIGDLGPIAELKELELLSLNDCTGVGDFRIVGKLTGLIHLSMERCSKLKDLAPLRNLRELMTLWLDGCVEVSDLRPLEAMKDLQHLSLNGCSGLHDLTPLSGLKNLFLVLLSDCVNVTDLTPLENLHKLEYLALSRVGASRKQQQRLLKATDARRKSREA